MYREQAVEERKLRGLTARLHHDEDPQNPREEYENLATFVFQHNRYNLGDGTFEAMLFPYDLDDFKSRFYGQTFPQDRFAKLIERYVRMRFKSIAFTWVGMYDHSGISIYPSSHDHRGWDSGVIGFAYVSEKNLEITETPRHLAEDRMLGEIKVYDQYLSGDVYGYEILDENGDHLDSCWGFYGRDYAEQEMELALDGEVELKKKKEAAKHG